MIRNVLLRNVIARGTGPNLIHGHVDSPLQNITLDMVRLEIGPTPSVAPRVPGSDAWLAEKGCLRRTSRHPSSDLMP